MKIVYTPNQVFDSSSFSPSPMKPKLLYEQWQDDKRIEWVDCEQVSLDDLYSVHDQDFVNGVLAGTIANGFNHKSVEQGQAILYTVGNFLKAADIAFWEGGVVGSLTSGFHHAGWSKAEGFCTFNGLMVVAEKLRRSHGTHCFILDWDHHWGNGTVNIIETLGINVTAGSESELTHLTFGGTRYFEWTLDEKWWTEIEQVIRQRAAGRDLILYQAGADPHVNDPGAPDGWMTTEDLKRRDEMVFKVAKELNIPIVWNLAGGYQSPVEKVLEIHTNTKNAALATYEA